MPETSTEIALSDADRDVLERVRQQYSLPSIEAAAEWLVKRRLRLTSKQLNGRGRALYLVRSKPKCAS
ncbi:MULTISPECIES: hypothetical protein [Burkholderia]|uniref:hypothetical protein n=1 Tax=Burkholderia TaxID=32008 RepID=UPI00098EF139|nr:MULTISPECIES: hypothetical protein [Burkholderia]AQT48769.1 hypothetical protein BHQ31_01335 [Burkholderia cenocepacia]MBJ9727774.1 hypothetical protein [Burkholderia cenocepacia]MCA8136235.1 hypothetical protein [Burkholderia cepacia]MDN7534514.1 hypothetical protein [Burkholderia orbicola]MEB2499183.1 hypothetical protein [Burkholderia cenocepacia]